MEEIRRRYHLDWGNHRLDLGDRTCVMGVLNVTPDSFADGGLHFKREKAIEHGLLMAKEGADIIDIGGESTRPYSERVPLEEEIQRTIPVIEALSKALTIPISIDTYKADVAREALKAGACMINDISALSFDPEMISVASEADVPVILMHIKGTPEHMQEKPTYDDVVLEIREFLRNAIERGVAGGIKKERIIVDPGIGFGKTFDHNLEIVKGLRQFATLERPLLLGTSRKAFIGHILNKDPHGRDTGTMASVTVGVLNGAHIVRVHNVEKAVETVKVADAIVRGRVS